jgi:hypothetical protein
MKGKKRLLRKFATQIVNEELPADYLLEGEGICWITDGDFVAYAEDSYYVNHQPVSRAVARDTILHMQYGKRAKRSYFNSYHDEDIFW